MQQLILHKLFYQIVDLDKEKYSKEAISRLHVIKQFYELKKEKLSKKRIFEIILYPPSTVYRWINRYKKEGIYGLENESKAPHNCRKKKWTNKDEQNVLKVRRKYVAWGKYKIHYYLKNQGVIISVSTIGRIISSAIKRGTIDSVAQATGKYIPKKRRFNQHAQQWKKGMKAKKPGQLVQVDHMTVKYPSHKPFKIFKAVDPITRQTYEQAYYSATSNIASLFLSELLSFFPFQVESIQVDGGSEFKAAFEESCKEKTIPLFVLPPCSPELNGRVERANGTLRYEFCNLYKDKLNLNIFRKHLHKFTHLYNHIRPHQALHYQTPVKYYQNLVASLSHML